MISTEKGFPTPALESMELPLHLLITMSLAAAINPGQALLLGNIMSVFTSPNMVARGNFISLMFFVMSLGILVIYFIMGWSTNTIAQVRASMSLVREGKSRSQSRIMILTTSVPYPRVSAGRCEEKSWSPSFARTSDFSTGLRIRWARSSAGSIPTRRQSWN